MSFFHLENITTAGRLESGDTFVFLGSDDEPAESLYMVLSVPQDLKKIQAVCRGVIIAVEYGSGKLTTCSPDTKVAMSPKEKITIRIDC